MVAEGHGFLESGTQHAPGDLDVREARSDARTLEMRYASRALGAGLKMEGSELSRLGGSYSQMVAWYAGFVVASRPFGRPSGHVVEKEGVSKVEANAACGRVRGLFEEGEVTCLESVNESIFVTLLVVI